MTASSSRLAEFHSLIHCQDNPRIKEIFQEIISLRWNGSSLREDKLSLLINLLLCELKEQQEKPVSASSSHNILAEASRLIQTTPQTFFLQGRTWQIVSLYVKGRFPTNLKRHTARRCMPIRWM